MESMLRPDTIALINMCEKVNVLCDPTTLFNLIASSFKVNHERGSADLMIQDALIELLRKESKLKTAEMMEVLHFIIQTNDLYRLLVKVKGETVAHRTKDKIVRKVLETIVDKIDQFESNSCALFISTVMRQQLLFHIELVD